jgi:hypothetical protein
MDPLIDLRVLGHRQLVELAKPPERRVHPRLA